MPYDGRMDYLDPDFPPQTARNAAIRALADKQVAAGPTPAVSVSGADQLMLWDAETGAPFFADASSVGGGTTGSPAYPIELAPCQWFWINSASAPYVWKQPMPTYSYSDGPDPLFPGAGATLSGAANEPALSNYVWSGDAYLHDGMLCGYAKPAPEVGDRVGFFDFDAETYEGIYVITALGDGTDPWVLTRATDANDGELPPESRLDYVVRMENTGNFAHTSRFDTTVDADTFTSWYGWSVGNDATVNVGYDSVAGSNGSGAIGRYTTALGATSMAIGAYATAVGDHSVAIGFQSSDIVSGQSPTTRILIGYQVKSVAGQTLPAYATTIGSQSGSANPISKLIFAEGDGYTFTPNDQGNLFVLGGGITNINLSDTTEWMLGASIRLINTTGSPVTVTPSVVLLNGVGGAASIPAGEMRTLVRTSTNGYWLA